MCARNKNSRLKLLSRIALIAMTLFLGLIIYKQLKSESPQQPVGFRPLAEGYFSQGIDVSHYQGRIDWDLLFQHSDSLVSFVFCKATEGTDYVDSRWKRNLKALRGRNIPVGAYHFFKPKVSAKQQAQHFLKHYQPESSDLPPVIDVEEDGETAAELRKNVEIWMTIVEKSTGRRPIIYTNYYMFTNIFQQHFKTDHFWIANYSDRPERLGDPRILYWQYSDRGKVPGITASVDLNMSKVKF